ncbi:hypothetical protein B5E65_10825 [Gemmiger sp. An120]|uniref:hypothetical protein n=1 Tax=Gemmiger sp. An120 TaxID=1965549 RepID=UPI000B38B2F7|nr:hypothetical protein [Gemmiger sp. An120]OUQ41781.1 hypothetical protein B5E65_10825 [Gemmiger sp. An120]
MPHIELTAIERKIQDTEKELQNLVAFSDDTMRTIMTSELDYRLSELKKQKEAMLAAFSKETISIRIYGDKVETGKISSRVLLAALGGFQSMLDSVANAMLNSPTSRGKIPGHIKDITEFEVVGTFAGSFGVRLEREVLQSGMSSGDTDINRALDELFNVLETLDNSEQLLSVITPCGKRTVMHYRQWIDDMRDNDVNLEVDWVDDSARTRKLHILKERAPSIITTLDTIDKIENEDVTLCGMLNGVNIRNRTFEMSVEGEGLIKGKASLETLISITDKIGTEIVATMIRSNAFTKAGIQKISWYMSKIENK